jgi:hypothetical protein
VVRCIEVCFLLLVDIPYFNALRNFFLVGSSDFFFYSLGFCFVMVYICLLFFGLVLVGVPGFLQDFLFFFLSFFFYDYLPLIFRSPDCDTIEVEAEAKRLFCIDVR